MSGLVAALVAGLAGLGSIYLHTERVSPESHLLYTQHLRGLRETDALIDAELLANRLELSRNYDELTRQTAKAQADARHVGTPPDYLSAADTLSLRDDARALLATVMAKSELIDRFKREDSVARNSLAYFPVAASRLIDQPQPEAGHGLISRYIRLVLAFSRQPDERHAEELAAMRTELGRIQLPASMQGRLDNLLLHGDKIMEVLPRLDRLTKEILALPTRGQLEHLNRNYGTAYSNALVLAGHFRNLLYTLSILLALFLAWTFASLLRTQRSLRKTHAELSQRLVAQSAAEKQLKLHATAFRNAHDGITLTDARGNILDVNPAFSRITGWERSEVIGRNPRVLKSGRHDAAFYESMWKSIQETGNWCGEIWNRNKYGEVYPELLSISAVHDETSGQLTNFVAVFSDIRRLKFQEHQLAQMAYYDPLTELPNRTLLADRFTQAIAYTRRSQSLMAICYLDLDGFKPINDRWGHEAGDRVLLEISQRLKQALRGNDTIARIGGDEFTLLLLGLDSQEECEEILRRLLGNIEQPLSCLPEPESVSASIGVTLFPLDDEEPDTLLRHADQAMYQAKQAGKRTFHVFDAAKDRNLRQRLDRELAGGEDHRQQGGQPQKALGPVQHAANLGPGIAGIFQPLAPGQLLFQPFPVGRNLPLATGQQQVIADAGTKLDESGRLHIVEVHHQARRQAEEIDAPIRLARQHGGDRQGRATDHHRPTGAGIQRRTQAFIEPDRAGLRAARHLLPRLARAPAGAQFAAQGIAAAHRLDVGQMGLASGHDHAGKDQGLGQAQIAASRLVAIAVRQGMVGGDDQVAAHHLLRFALQALAHPVAEETDGRDRRHGNQQGSKKQPQLAGTQFPSQQPPGERSDHGRTDQRARNSAEIGRAHV